MEKICANITYIRYFYTRFKFIRVVYNKDIYFIEIIFSKNMYIIKKLV